MLQFRNRRSRITAIQAHVFEEAMHKMMPVTATPTTQTLEHTHTHKEKVHNWLSPEKAARLCDKEAKFRLRTKKNIHRTFSGFACGRIEMTIWNGIRDSTDVFDQMRVVYVFRQMAQQLNRTNQRTLHWRNDLMSNHELIFMPYNAQKDRQFRCEFLG